ncbi:autotransporter domain-containing protein [Gracilinema caldarium]|uniref:Uncharacterized protein n=1 Tax=Gracilinema caldarium (strain ATCC 51460 / DSM 7334 / H1) TaxID=744872 RepID=F8F3U7_GRAC1|nr:autotransporter domain-containing protein [Gracilinema caldarium]AEJ20466.1 hypothetical protein Spica_2356 [Gracilinema caldarium DSM 7334]
MKKLLAGLCTLALCAGSLWAEDTLVKEQDYSVKVSGDVNLVIKKQDSYRCPFDIPEWGWDQRAGASDRDTQWYRITSNLTVSSGILGRTEWFGVVSLAADVNSPDNNKTTFTSNGTIDEYNLNTEIKKIELTNAFVMWRPELLGGRPLGITLGNFSIAQTANAAYSHVFSGDPDSDFIGYTISALMNKPMIHIDFHISGDTGIGIALVKGASDFIQNSAGFDDKTAFTGVLWAEAAYKGFALNTAYQYTRGNRRIIKNVSIDDSSVTYPSLQWDPKYWNSNFNALISYQYNTELFGIKPFIGYNLQYGQEASMKEIQELTQDYKTKMTLAQVVSGGTVISSKIGSIPIRLSGEYSKVIIPDLNGLDALEDGNLDRKSVLEGINNKIDLLNMSLPHLSEGVFKDLCGSSDTVYTFAGLDAQYHFELAADLSSQVTVSLFMNGTLPKTTDYKVTEKQRQQMIDRVIAQGIPAPVATGIVDGLIQEIDKSNDIGTRWTKTMSYGLTVTYRF